MTFTQSVKTCLIDKFFNFKERASRSEFWWFMLFKWLFVFFITVPISLLSEFSAMIAYFVITLVLLFPTIAVIARRSHDYFEENTDTEDPAIGNILLLLLPWILTLINFMTNNSIFTLIAGISQLCILVLIIHMIKPSHVYANKYGEKPE